MGIQLAAGDIAKLVVLLEKAGYTDLAQRLGRAVDANSPDVPITGRDHKAIASVLARVPEGPLGELRETIEREPATTVHLD